jgi:hypothetical protein
MALPGRPEISGDAFWRTVTDLIRNHGGSTGLDRGWREVASPSFADPELQRKYLEMERLAGGSL